MSIKPKFYEKIINGEKKVEYRKKTPKDINEIFLYVSNPIKEIKAILYIDYIIKAAPDKIWEKTNQLGGIDHESFEDYCKGKEFIYAIYIKSIKILDKKIKLKNFTAPQNYLFRQDEEFSDLVR